MCARHSRRHLEMLKQSPQTRSEAEAWLTNQQKYYLALEYRRLLCRWHANHKGLQSAGNITPAYQYVVSSGLLAITLLNWNFLLVGYNNYHELRAKETSQHQRYCRPNGRREYWTCLPNNVANKETPVLHLCASSPCSSRSRRCGET